MNGGYRLIAFAKFNEGDSLLIPIFKLGHGNMTYAYVTNRQLIIEEFLAWPQASDFIIPYNPAFETIPATLKTRVVGDPAVFACDTSKGLFVGEFSDLSAWYDAFKLDLGGSLLEIQILRLANSPISNLYGKLEGFSERVFRRASSVRLFLRSELSLRQSQNEIWQSIDRHRIRYRGDENAKIKELLSSSREDMVSWLLKNQFNDPLWPAAWIAVEERIGMDERLERMALDWLIAEPEEWVFERASVGIFRRLVNFYLMKGDATFEFLDLISLMLEEDLLFTPGAPFRPLDYVEVLELVSVHIDIYTRISFLVSAIEKVPYDAKVTTYMLRELVKELEYADLSARPQLRRQIESEIINNRQLLIYSRLSEIDRAMKDLTNIMSQKHSSR